MGRATRVRSRWKQRSDRSIAPSVSGSSSEIQPAPVPKGEFAPDIVVVLSDGASNTGPQPLEAALQAVERGVRIYTIGYGTASGSEMNCGDQCGVLRGWDAGHGFGDLAIDDMAPIPVILTGG